MTREDAIEISTVAAYRVVASLREHLPQARVDRLEREAAEDCVDSLIALGLLKVDAESPQETASD